VFGGGELAPQDKCCGQFSAAPGGLQQYSGGAADESRYPRNSQADLLH